MLMINKRVTGGAFATALVAGLAFLACGVGPTSAGSVIYGSAYVGNTGAASLYAIDPSTGSGTLIGGIGFNRVSALDFNPSNGLLYGVGNDGSGHTDLLTINTATGAGTLVGSLGLGGNVSQDIAFRPSDGTLFSYSFGSIYTINTTTGAATLLHGDPNGFPRGNALAFSSASTLYTADESALRTVDQTSGGTITPLVNLTYPIGGNRANGMKFDFSTGILFASVVSGFPGNSNYFATIDIGSGTVTNIGGTVTGLDAIAIQGVVIPLPAALPLFATGLGVMGLLTSRRKRKDAAAVAAV